MSGNDVALEPTPEVGTKFPWPMVSVDVETNPADDNRIFLIGAVRSDDGRDLTLSVRRTSSPNSSA